MSIRPSVVARTRPTLYAEDHEPVSAPATLRSDEAIVATLTHEVTEINDVEAAFRARAAL